MSGVRTSCVVVALGLLTSWSLAACSQDERAEPTPTATLAAPAPEVDPVRLAAGLAALYAGNSALPQDRTEGRCFAEALQARLDQEALVAAGIVGPDGEVADVLPVFDEPTATAWVDAQLSCVGFVESSTRALLTQTRGALDATAYADCLRGALTDEQVRAALVQTLSGGFDSPEVAALADAQAGCTG